MSSFDEKAYWIQRHEKFRGDPRSVGNMSRTVEQNLQAQDRGTGGICDLASMLFPRRTVLDLACGTGRVANKLIDLGFAYTGVDISPTAIDEAGNTCPRGEFYVGDIISFSPERRYDLVLALHVFVHLVEDPDWEKALDVVTSSLKPDGLFLLRDPLPAVRERVNVHVLTRGRAEYESALSARGLQFTDEGSHELPGGRHSIFHYHARLWPAHEPQVGRSTGTAGILE